MPRVPAKRLAASRGHAPSPVCPEPSSEYTARSFTPLHYSERTGSSERTVPRTARRSNRTSMARRAWRALSLLSLASVGLIAGCKATAADIEEWKGTVKGPGKIVAVLQSDNYDLDLRTRAAIALVEMAPRTQPEPLDPVAELQRAIQRLDESTRAEIINAMVPGLEELMTGGDSAAAESEGPPPEQVRAKDAAFLLIPQASGESRARLERAVVGWYVADFNGRNLAGNYSAEQIVRTLGSSAASILVDAMSPEMPQAALVKLAELIGQLGNNETKTRAGQRLVEIQQTMEGDEFLEWLREQIRDSMREQMQDKVADLGVRYTVQNGKLALAEVPNGSPASAANLRAGDVILGADDTEFGEATEGIRLLSGPEDSQVRVRYQRGGQTGTATVTRKINGAKVDETARLNRERFINEGVLPAMKHLNEVPTVSTRLLAVAEQTSQGEDDPVTTRRRRALMALEGGAKDTHLERLLNLAMSSDVPSAVRDNAFDRVGDVRNASAIPRMWPLLQTTSYENDAQRLRWRAGEMILYIGGGNIIDEFFRRLPSDSGVKYEPEELEGFAQRLSQMSPAPTARMRRELRSDKWWNRVIALRYFERKGAESDLAALRRLTSDQTAVAGDAWRRLEITDVGDVAEKAIAAFRERLSGESSQDQEGSEGGGSASPEGR